MTGRKAGIKMSNDTNRLDKIWVIGLMASVLTLAAIPVLAQMPTGTILGVVKDASGGVVPDVTITILNAETSLERTTTTGSDGAYRVSALPVGPYTVKF